MNEEQLLSLVWVLCLQDHEGLLLRLLPGPEHLLESTTHLLPQLLTGGQRRALSNLGGEDRGTEMMGDMKEGHQQRLRL